MKSLMMDGFDLDKKIESDGYFKFHPRRSSHDQMKFNSMCR